MIHHWEGFELEIADFEYHYDQRRSAGTVPSQTLKHVEIVKVSDNHT